VYKYIVLFLIVLSITTYIIFPFKLPIKLIARDLFSKEKPIETAQNVDINRYQGLWYSLYEFYAWFQGGCNCTKAEYTLISEGKVEVKNSCYREGAISTVSAIAWPIIDGDNSKLYVKFNPFSKGKYYIISLDEDYQHALVGTPDRNYLWILSRTTTIDDLTLAAFKSDAEKLGFDSSRLLEVNQSCTVTN